MPCYNIPNYTSYANTRKDKRGGGICVFIRNDYQFSPTSITGVASEILTGLLESPTGNILYIVALYRPPKTNKNKFIQDLDGLLSNIPNDQDIVVAGDVNINILNGYSCATVNRYREIMYRHGLQCAYDDVTREEIVDGKITLSCVDHIWARVFLNKNNKCVCLSSYVLSGGKISDHYAAGICLHQSVSPTSTNKGNHCAITIVSNKLVQDKLKKVDWDSLNQLDCPLLLYNKLCDVFGEIYQSSKTNIQPKYRQNHSWIDNSLLKLTEQRDYLFRQWKASPKNAIRKLEYIKFRNKVNKLIYVAKNNNRKTEILKCGNDFRKI